MVNTIDMDAEKREDSEREFCFNCEHCEVDEFGCWECGKRYEAEWDEEHEGWDCPKMKWRKEEWLY